MMKEEEKGILRKVITSKQFLLSTSHYVFVCVTF